jgi:NTP pyrophosphatase (non-canonical NTP hydrolase)
VDFPSFHWKNRKRFLPPTLYRAFGRIAAERERQEVIHPDSPERDMTLPLEYRLLVYHAILVEEVGELARTILRDDIPERHTPEARAKEALHCAAVSVAIMEALEAEQITPTNQV